MNGKLHSEILDLTGNIQDGYLRAVTYARLGYNLYHLKSPMYKRAFDKALTAVNTIKNPYLMAKALLEIGTYIHSISEKASKKVFRQAYEAIKGFPQPIKDDLLEELVLRVLELNVNGSVVEYALSIENEIKRNEILLRLVKHLINSGSIQKARSIVGEISEEPWKSLAIIELLKAHLQREEFGSVMLLLQMLDSEYWISEAMREIARRLKDADVPRETYEKFVNVAMGLSEENRFNALKALLVSIGELGEIDFVLNVLSKLEDPERLEMLRSLVGTIVDREDLLLELIKKVDKRDFDQVARYIMDNLLEGPIDEVYKPAVLEIGKRTPNESILVKVTTYLAKLGDFSTAMRFASHVSDNYLRSLAFGSIAVAMLKKNNVSGAIDAALEVKDPRWGSWLLSEILVKILELERKGVVKEDIEKKAFDQRTLWEKSGGS